MENVIDLINKVQDVCSTIGGNEGLDLPQIITVGEQSSGKSSVLETIVKRDFLPRGSGVVTRRPLVLQLMTHDSHDYAEFLHVPNKKFYDFAEVRREIEEDTNRVAGHNKGISRQAIHLKIYSRNVLNLTLVDLPGLTKFPIGTVKEQVIPIETIILAVTPANSDLANSDSLKIARMVDPAGHRTIGVITKLDLMDAGTHALDILSGRTFPLKLGFVGVVNRSQQDILTNKPMDEALAAEKLFFQRHSAYRTIANRSGAEFLAQQLNTILVHHIRERLPDLRSKLSSIIGQTQHELAQYGDPTFVGTVHQLLTMFSTEFVASIDGTSSEISTKELSGGARIYFIFNNIFGYALDALSPCANLTDDDIRVAIRNSTGPRCSLFVPELAFDLLVRPQIKLLEAPSLRCVDLAFEELSKICHTCSNKLNTKLIEIVSDLLRERLQPTSDYVKSLIEIECAYINTNHPDFPGATKAMTELQQQRLKRGQPEKKKQHIHTKSLEAPARERSASVHSTSSESFLNYFFGSSPRPDRIDPTEHQLGKPNLGPPAHIAPSAVTDNYGTDDVEVELIRYLITSYFNIVRKSIQDVVPKTIMHLLVNFTRESVQNRLVTELYKEQLFSELLEEDPAMAVERAKWKSLLDIYKKAFSIINDIM
ncbi:Dynamin- GTPase protein [Apophysomyces ossiformis]|uniref:Dynamin- GTPase protein n=1 Tax=Apophysomyces ossiformis TaxID=679940 RepID=A0A8H7BS42_9FUNG|nr:Dynamin- GTPase protein [Apophysomyces ossiformis]